MLIASGECSSLLQTGGRLTPFWTRPTDNFGGPRGPLSGGDINEYFVETEPACRAAYRTARNHRRAGRAASVRSAGMHRRGPAAVFPAGDQYDNHFGSPLRSKLRREGLDRDHYRHPDR